MGVQQGDDGDGIDVLPLVVGDGTYAVKLDRVATVLRPSVFEERRENGVVELSDHTVAVEEAARLLGERAGQEDAIVVFNRTLGNGTVPGWLVDDVGQPATVESVRPTVGAMRAVRGKVYLQEEEAVLLDPVKLHGR